MKIISQDRRSWVDLSVVEVRPNDAPDGGDVCVGAVAQAAGFSGENPAVWIDGEELRRFAAELLALAQTRCGSAKLRGMNYQADRHELELEISAADEAGHLTAHVLLRRHNTVQWLEARLEFEADPTAVSQFASELQALGERMGA